MKWASNSDEVLASVEHRAKDIQNLDLKLYILPSQSAFGSIWNNNPYTL